MSDFTKGVVATVVIAAFAKGIYELGKVNEQAENAKRCKALAITLNELSKKNGN